LFLKITNVCATTDTSILRPFIITDIQHCMFSLQSCFAFSNVKKLTFERVTGFPHCIIEQKWAFFTWKSAEPCVMFSNCYCSLLSYHLWSISPDKIIQ
jgi:hypothetical protein